MIQKYDKSLGLGLGLENYGGLGLGLDKKVLFITAKYTTQNIIYKKDSVCEILASKFLVVIKIITKHFIWGNFSWTPFFKPYATSFDIAYHTSHRPRSALTPAFSVLLKLICEDITHVRLTLGHPGINCMY